ncbi:MAG: DUF2239 family protein [Terracidiphilus sp.]
MDPARRYTAFLNDRIVTSGPLEQVLPKLKAIFNRNRGALFLVFDDETGKPTDFNLSGTLLEILKRECHNPEPGGPGRPRLGVVSREITLLPRQWEWLELQPNGASAAVRRLIDSARKNETAQMRKQRAIHATGRVLTAIAGNYPDYEEASRALYRGENARFAKLMDAWPRDVRNYALRLSRSHGP